MANGEGKVDFGVREYFLLYFTLTYLNMCKPFHIDRMSDLSHSTYRLIHITRHNRDIS